MDRELKGMDLIGKGLEQGRRWGGGGLWVVEQGRGGEGGGGGTILHVPKNLFPKFGKLQCPSIFLQTGELSTVHDLQGSH